MAIRAKHTLALKKLGLSDSDKERIIGLVDDDLSDIRDLLRAVSPMYRLTRFTATLVRRGSVLTRGFCQTDMATYSSCSSGMKGCVTTVR